MYTFSRRLSKAYWRNNQFIQELGFWQLSYGICLFAGNPTFPKVIGFLVALRVAVAIIFLVCEALSDGVNQLLFKMPSYEWANEIYQDLPEEDQKKVDDFIHRLIADQERDDARKLEGG